MRSYRNATAKWPVILRWLPLFSIFILFAVLAGGTLAGTASAAQPVAPLVQQETEGGGCQPWEFSNAPNPRTHHYLNDIDALAPDDIWAVGEYYDDQNYTPDTALTMHWDGTQWTIVPTPEGAFSARLTLNAVSAVAPDDVWAVGENVPGSQSSQPSAYQPLAMHWDGIQWTLIETPQEPGGFLLNDVVALAPNNVWAVGANDGAHATRAMNWDGTAWSIVPTPNGGMFSDDNVLTSISAVSANDMWAVGYIYPKGGTPRTISMHWNGAQWSMVTTPNPGNYSRRLDAVDAISASDVWAVGSYSADFGSTYTPLFLHWNGTAWQQIASPEFNDYNSLRAVYAIAPNDVWAVGTTAACDFCNFETLTMHWDGTAWSVVFSPNGFRDFSRLEGVTATSSGDVWAVGFTDERNFPYTSDSLILRKVCNTGTPTASPTGPPPTATRTRTSVPTYTNTPTRTVAATPTCSPNGLSVLVVYADYTTPPATLRNGMLANPGVYSVDYYRADSTTPPLSLLMQYDMVVAFANVTSWADPTTLGNRLADYQDAHGIVVAFNFSWSGPPRGILGRWQSGNYSPFESFGGNIYSTGTLGSYNAGHPLMQGVANLSAFYRANLVLKPGAEQVAAWNDGLPLIATKGRAVGVSAYVGDEDGGWSGDFSRIVVNAGLWLRANNCNGTPAPTSTAGAASPTRTATMTRTTIATATPGGPPYCTAPSFAPDTEFAVGDDPQRSVVADFNEDGIPDIAVVRRNTANLSVLIGNGDGGFGPAALYDLDTQPTGITYGDYNRDGNLDLAASGYGVRMAIILLGDGAGGFGTATAYGSGSDSAGLTTADFNEDGNPDIVIADDGHDTMLVLINNGSGGFGAGVQYTLDWIPTDIAVGDFNRDGNVDVAAPNSFSDNVSVRLGNGTGGFGGLQNYTVAQNPRSITIGDFNGDSNPDFATSSGDTGFISMRLGNGAGGFGGLTNYPAGNGSMSIGQADFNGDGTPDLAVANVPGNVAVLLGNGTGGFGPLMNFSAGSGPVAVSVGDFNRDAKPDLAVTNNTGDNISVLINTCSAPLPTPTINPQATSTAAASSTTVASATAVASGTVVQPSATTAQATSTRTVVASTATSVVSTATAGVSTTTPTNVAGATSTPQACAITFTDVPSEHPFYSYVMCLACRNILGGYTDGTFRPNNEITRGQIAKMVSNSAGFGEDPGAQIYEDVPPESPFYSWINRLSMRGHMGGYNCGLFPEEPCGLGNRPYFRPAASATRGQLAKIVANAAGLSGAPSGIFYTDVQEDNPFYVWIMRLTTLNVMSGYTCGGSNEPCDESNRPYFRPFNSVTRGQTSKIVSNTFFPACNP